MSLMEQDALTRLSRTTSFNLNAAADTETAFYVVPTGKKVIVDNVRPLDLSGSAGSAVITVGKIGGSCDEFVGDTTLANLNGTTKTCKIQPVPNSTPPAQVVFVAGETIGGEITTPAGSTCTATMDLWGYEKDA